MKQFFQKIIIPVSLFSLLLFVLIFLYNGKGKGEALAIEEYPAERTLICEEKNEDDEKENKLEIPIGRATDQAEFLAEKIIQEMEKIIRWAHEQSGKAGNIVDLADDCSIDNCEPSCDKETSDHHLWLDPPKDAAEDKCDDYPEGKLTDRVKCQDASGNITEVNESECGDDAGEFVVQYQCRWVETICKDTTFCSGEPCPSGISDRLSEIIERGELISEGNQKIGLYLAEFTEPEQGAMVRLDKSRTRLADCVLRAYDIEPVLRGEKAGKFLLNCENILNVQNPIHSYLNWKQVNLGLDVLVPRFLLSENQLETGCYGNTYCQASYEKTYCKENCDGASPVPYPPPPCAEDYYCCY